MLFVPILKQPMRESHARQRTSHKTVIHFHRDAPALEITLHVVASINTATPDYRTIEPPADELAHAQGPGPHDIAAEPTSAEFRVFSRERIAADKSVNTG